MSAFLKTNERSGLFSLNLRDFIKGALYAIVAAVVIFLADLFKAGPLAFDLILLTSLGKVALATLVAYVAANFLQNSKGNFAKELP